MNVSDALRAQARVLDALADEAEAREAQTQVGDPLLTDSMIAADLGVHRSQACRLRRLGLLGPVVWVGKRPRIARSSLDRYKRAQQMRRSA